MTLKIMLVILCLMVITLSIIGIEREKTYKKLANERAKDEAENFAKTGQMYLIFIKSGKIYRLGIYFFAAM